MSQDFADRKVEGSPQGNSKERIDESAATTAAQATAVREYDDHQYIPESYSQTPIDSQAPTIQHEGRSLGPIANAILWIEPVWVAALAPLLLFPGQFVSSVFQPILVIALFAFWPIRLILQRRITPQTPLDGMLVILLLLVPIGIWVSPDKEASWIATGYLLLGVAIYVAIVNWPPNQRYPWLVGIGLAVVGGALAAVGPTILAAAPSKLFENPDFEAAVEVARASGIETVNPNILAGGLVFVLPLLLALALHSRLVGGTSDSQRDSVLSIVLMMLCWAGAIGVGAVLFLTQSRGAYLGAGIACWLVLWLKWPKAWYAWLLLLAATVGTISWFGADQLLGQSRFDHSINSYEGRTEIWIRTAESLFDFPLTGIGIGTFENGIQRLYPFSFYEDKGIPHAHNMILQVGADLGLLGVSALIGLIAAVLIMISKVIAAQRMNPSNIYVALAIGATGSIAAMLVHGLFDSALWGTKLSPIPWMMYGMVVLLPIEQQKRRRRRRRRSE